MTFPNPNSADENGLLCVGGELSKDTLMDAYSKGIFPWPQENLPLLWFSPPERGMLDFSDFHVPRSARKLILSRNFKVTCDQAFPDVIEACARIPRDGETGTWITPEVQKSYIELHKLGYAHSFEAWKNQKLVGGLYGIYIKNVFSGESMFFKESGASKACLVTLVEHLRSMNLGWIDIQMVTPILEMFGGKYVPRDEFLKIMKKAQNDPRPWKSFH